MREPFRRFAEGALSEIELWRVAVTVALLVFIALGVMLVRLLRRLRQEFELHHRLITPVATMDGLVQALAAALERGGLTAKQRRAIYAAHAEQVAIFRRIIATHDADKDAVSLPPPEPPAPSTTRTPAVRDVLDDLSLRQP